MDGKTSSAALIKKLKALIEKDPDFLDPYTLLAELYKERNQPKKAKQATDSAYLKALNLITSGKGKWPKLIDWRFIENRHVIRALLNKAMMEWDEGNNDVAIDLFRKLVKSNPEDNIGARHFLLAATMGFTMLGFELKFDKGGHYGMELFEWFEEHCWRYPEEFEWWIKWAEEQDYESDPDQSV